MRTYVVAFFLSIGIAAFATSAVLRLARRFNLYDHPDGERKVHETPIPRLGGLGIAAGFLGPIVGLLFYTNLFALQLQRDDGRLLSFFAGLALILILGLWDDLKGCGAWQKLGIQGLAGLVLWMGGISFESVTFFGITIEAGLASLPLTVLWVAAIVNAMNLIDGLDGLAGGVAFFAAVSLFTIAILDNNPILALFAAALGGSVLGFLLYNFEPALIFMGDAGSMAIGYIFAAAALWSAGKRTTAMAIMIPMLALGLPIFDTVFAFARRAISGKSPFTSDRAHVHHRLIDEGMSHRQSVLVLYSVCCLLTIAAIVVRSTQDPFYGIVLVGVSGCIYMASRALFRRLQRRAAVEKARAEKAENSGESRAEAGAELAAGAPHTEAGGVVVPLRRDLPARPDESTSSGPDRRAKT